LSSPQDEAASPDPFATCCVNQIDFRIQAKGYRQLDQNITGNDIRVDPAGARPEFFAEAQSVAASIRLGSSYPGIQRLETCLSGQGLAPHRQDVYKLGITLGGVISSRYRGEMLYCPRGKSFIVHPDELHDGGPAMGESCLTRAIFIDPALIQQALDGKPLPFVANSIVERPDLYPHFLQCFEDFDEDLDEMAAVDITSAISGTLRFLSQGSPRKEILCLSRLLRVREAIMSDPANNLSAQDMEDVANLDRWTIARQFRAAFGTSPTRFRTMRQLDQVHTLIGRGIQFSEAAAEAGFADQSHMTRMFKRTYGLTPRQWALAQTI
jgi:AraC-like DNA-binding protein